MNTLLENPGAKAVVTPKRKPANPSQRILVVDDDVAMRLFNTHVLVRSGYQVDAAEDGAAGWEALHANTYDLLITDNNMPKISGVELVKKLRSARMALPVILASGEVPAEDLNRIPWLQPAKTLLKPYTDAELLGTVREFLRATDSAGDQIAPRLTWQNQPSPDGFWK